MQKRADCKGDTLKISMRNLIFLFLASFCFFNKTLAIDTISYINEKDEISFSNNHIDSFWMNLRLSHYSSDYTEKSYKTINVNNGK